MISISLENFADLLSKAVAEYDITGCEKDNIRSIFLYNHNDSYSFEVDNLIFTVNIRHNNVPKKDDLNCMVNAFIKYDKTRIFQCDMMHANKESVKELFDKMLKRYE